MNIYWNKSKIFKFTSSLIEKRHVLPTKNLIHLRLIAIIEFQYHPNSYLVLDIHHFWHLNYNHCNLNTLKVNNFIYKRKEKKSCFEKSKYLRNTNGGFSIADKINLCPWNPWTNFGGYKLIVGLVNLFCLHVVKIFWVLLPKPSM